MASFGIYKIVYPLSALMIHDAFSVFSAVVTRRPVLSIEAGSCTTRCYPRRERHPRRARPDIDSRLQAIEACEETNRACKLYPQS